jgi:hypothetical protein
MLTALGVTRGLRSRVALLLLLNIAGTSVIGVLLIRRGQARESGRPVDALATTLAAGTADLRAARSYRLSVYVDTEPSPRIVLDAQNQFAAGTVSGPGWSGRLAYSPTGETFVMGGEMIAAMYGSRAAALARSKWGRIAPHIPTGLDSDVFANPYAIDDCLMQHGRLSSLSSTPAGVPPTVGLHDSGTAITGPRDIFIAAGRARLLEVRTHGAAWPRGGAIPCLLISDWGKADVIGAPVSVRFSVQDFAVLIRMPEYADVVDISDAVIHRAPAA